MLFSFTLLFIAIAVVAVSAVIITVLFYFVVIGGLRGAPYVRSKKEKIAAMLKLADIKAGEKVVDLGSGDGTIVIEAARRGAHATGVEFNPFLVWYSRWKIRNAGLSSRAHITKGDVRDYPLNTTDTVFVYLLPGLMEKLTEKFSNELRPGTRIISNAFTFADQTPEKEESGVFLYRPH